MQLVRYYSLCETLVSDDTVQDYNCFSYIPTDCLSDVAFHYGKTLLIIGKPRRFVFDSLFDLEYFEYSCCMFRPRFLPL